MKAPRSLGPLAILALVSCVSPPRSDRALFDVEVPSRWTAQIPPAETPAPGPPPEPWWQGFGDAELDRIVGDVMARNLDLAATSARLEVALAQARIAGAAIEPQLSLAVDSSRRKQVFVGLPIPGAGDRPLSNTSTSIGAALNVAWEPDLWGRLRSARAGARALAEAAAADLDAARLSLSGQAAKTWFTLIAAQAQVRLAEETLASRRATSEQIRRRYDRGLRPALELRLARTAEAAAEVSLAGRRRALDATQRQLRLLSSRYPSATILAAPGLPRLPPPIPAGVPAEMISRRPDLAAIERRLAATGLRVAEAKAAFFPQLRLTGSAGRLGQEVDDLLDDELSVWSLAAQLLQPIFQGGRLRAGVDAAQAGFEEAVRSYAQAILRAFAEVEQALITEDILGQQVAALTTAAEDSLAAAKLAEDRYLRGVGDYLTFLEAQRQSTQARSQLVEVELQRLTNRVDLHLALGGGWSASGSAITSDGGGSNPATRGDSS